MDENPRIEHSFLVRVWREPEAHRCRGYVVHVSTNQRTYFSELTDLLEFIRRRFAFPGVGLDAGDAGATSENDD